MSRRPADLLPARGSAAPEQPRPEPALVVCDVAKRWRTWTEPILDGVDLELAAGSSVWVAGRNGTGKTTLLRILAGMIAPDRGTVRLHGLDPERDARSYRTMVGLVSAGSTGLFARLSARRHLEYWSRLAFLPRSERPQAVARAIEAFSLEEIAGRRVDRLSMGQRQRVRLAMAFLHEPRLVLLDEPLTSLDDEGAALLREAIADLLARGGALVWCSPVGEHTVLDRPQRVVMQAGRLEPA